MNVAGAPTRPVLRWHGGKWKLAPWILAHLPPHRVYVEPFGGAASILFRKERSYAEVYNDLDDEVINFFRVLRDDAARLIEVLQLTPYARGELEEAFEVVADPMERARRLVVRCFLGFGSNAHSVGEGATSVGRSTGFRANSNRSGTTPAHDWVNYPPALPAAIERWRGVIIESRPAVDVIAQHDAPTTLFYVDPPYLPETRSPANKYDLKHRMYRHEMDRGGHADLLAFLCQVAGMVVLSGYPDPLYDAALSGWRRVETAAFADGARPRTEVLWINPAASAALDAQRAPLFAGLER